MRFPTCLQTRFLSLKTHAHMQEMQRFFIIGLGNLVFFYAVYMLVNIIAPYAIAFTVSLGASILFSAYWNARLSFSTPLTTKRLAAFTIVCVINYLIGLQILKFFIESLGIDEALAPILVIAVMVPISFVGTRLALVGSLSKSRQSATDE